MTRSPPAHVLRPAQRFAPRMPRAKALAECQRLVLQHRITAAELLPTMEPEPEAKFTRGPSYTHDPRYQVDPAARVVGAFTTEWRRLRGEG